MNRFMRHLAQNGCADFNFARQGLEVFSHSLGRLRPVAFCRGWKTRLRDPAGRLRATSSSKIRCRTDARSVSFRSCASVGIARQFTAGEQHTSRIAPRPSSWLAQPVPRLEQPKHVLQPINGLGHKCGCCDKKGYHNTVAVRVLRCRFPATRLRNATEPRRLELRPVLCCTAGAIRTSRSAPLNLREFRFPAVGSARVCRSCADLGARPAALGEVQCLKWARSCRQCRPTAGAQNLRPVVETRSPAPPFLVKVRQSDSGPACRFSWTDGAA
jgi:hypothetical protein